MQTGWLAAEMTQEYCGKKAQEQLRVAVPGKLIPNVTLGNRVCLAACIPHGLNSRNEWRKEQSKYHEAYLTKTSLAKFKTKEAPSPATSHKTPVWAEPEQIQHISLPWTLLLSLATRQL